MASYSLTQNQCSGRLWPALSAKTMWSKKTQKCSKCKTTRRKHKARGLCTACYPIQLKIEKVQNWNLHDVNTLKHCPKELLKLNEDEFRLVQKNVISQLEKRQMFFAVREKILNSNVDGMNLEYLFQRIAKLCGIKNRGMFHGSCDIFSDNFDSKQRKILYELLIEIEESIKWKGINWAEVFNY